MERMRRAEWRRQADDPTGLLGWWWRGLAENGLRYDLLVWGCLVAFMAALAGIVWPMLPIGAYALVLALWGNKREPDRLAGLLPDPAPSEQFRTRVIYKREEMVTGCDEVALTVIDGWLVAEGVRSYFALRPQDVIWLSIGSISNGLLVTTDQGEIRLHALGEAAQGMIKRWHQPRSPIEGQPIFPPARAHPQEEARWRIWMVAGVAMVTVLPIEMLLSRGSIADALACASFVVGLIVFVFGSAKRHDLSVESTKAMRESSERRSPQGKASVQAGLSPRPPLQNEPFGEGESVRMKSGRSRDQGGRGYSPPG